MAGPEAAAANPRERNANGDGAACKWQHTDAPIMISLVKNRCSLSTTSYQARRLNVYLTSLKKWMDYFFAKTG